MRMMFLVIMSELPIEVCFSRSSCKPTSRRYLEMGWHLPFSELRLQLINPNTSPNELSTTLTPHSIIHGNAPFAYFPCGCRLMACQSDRVLFDSFPFRFFSGHVARRADVLDCVREGQGGKKSQANSSVCSVRGIAWRRSNLGPRIRSCLGRFGHTRRML